MTNTNSTTSTNNTTTNTTTIKTLTAQAIAQSIATHSSNHGDFTKMIRSLSSATTGRAKIEKAALILLSEQRELLAVAKQFKTFEQYQAALSIRIEAKQAGSKNELKNASGIKCGQKEVQNFYSLINAALKGQSSKNNDTNKIERSGCASHNAPDGYKLAFDLDSDCFSVEKYVKKAPVKSAGSENAPIKESSTNSDNSEQSAGDSDNSEEFTNDSKSTVKSSDKVADSAPLFDLSSTLDQLQHLSVEDVQTLASAIVNASDDKMVTLCSAIENALNTKIDRDSKRQAHALDLDGLEIAASKATSELMTAKTSNVVKSSTVVRLTKVSKQANEALVNCQNSLSLEARQY